MSNDELCPHGVMEWKDGCRLCEIARKDIRIAQLEQQLAKACGLSPTCGSWEPGRQTAPRASESYLQAALERRHRVVDGRRDEWTCGQRAGKISLSVS